jgi:hypothetical protein
MRLLFVLNELFCIFFSFTHYFSQILEILLSNGWIIYTCIFYKFESTLESRRGSVKSCIASLKIEGGGRLWALGLSLWNVFSFGLLRRRTLFDQQQVCIVLINVIFSILLRRTGCSWWSETAFFYTFWARGPSHSILHRWWGSCGILHYVLDFTLMLILHRLWTFAQHYLLNFIGKWVSVEDLSESTFTRSRYFFALVWLLTFAYTR